MSYRDDDNLNLAKLSDDERLAFGGLIRLVVGIDHTVTPDEVRRLDGIAEKVGVEPFWQSIKQAESDASEPERVKELAMAVTDPAVRELIYACVAEVAEANTITPTEGSLLTALENMWKLKPVVLKDEAEG